MPAWVFLHATNEDVERILQEEASNVTAAKSMPIVSEAKRRMAQRTHRLEPAFDSSYAGLHTCNASEI